ncbi:ATP-grasp domain-containing protein [uncultured Methanoregula sp.]|uniref:ATP-grasp domain-containing protein n=1 Tax=uncultured Methanoregula sp. TaxID=1005933 RepID=UPI002AAADFE8|nr:ATP-grasp domain-containing protein [uncultured Methanoregula sp.]
MKGRVLIAGFSTRHVAQSAYNAGYEVCTVDHFCDQDLAWYTRDREKFEDLADLPDAIERICRRQTFDLFVPTSGAEELVIPLLRGGTPHSTVARFMDKLDTQHFFEDHSIPVPRILTENQYPVMAKPRRGAGGWRNAILKNRAAETAWESLYPDVPYIRQDVVEGIPASVCCVASGTKAVAVAANGQILRGAGESAFGFSGSITPFSHLACNRMIELAERIAALSGCRGTIGIDFVIGDKTPFAIEINPRFQGTVDTVEHSCGCNLFELHVNACAGNLPSSRPACRQFAVRSILFAERDLTIRTDLAALKDFVADIPWPGTSLEEEQAIVSVYGWGKTKDAALALLDKHITIVRQYMR